MALPLSPYADEASRLLKEARDEMDQAPDKALRAARKSWELLKKVGDLDGAGEAFRAIIGSTISKGDVDGALQMASDECDAARQQGDQLGMGVALLGMAEIHLYQESGEDALRCVEASREALQHVEDAKKTKADAAITECQARIMLGDSRRVGRIATDALQLAKASGDRRVEATAWHVLAGVESGKSALEAAERARDLYRQVGDKKSEGCLLRNLCQLLLAAGRREDALQAGSDAMAIFDTLRLPVAQIPVLRALASDKLDHGEARDALEFLQQKVEELQRANQEKAEAGVLLLMADVHLADGDGNAALRVATAAKDIFAAQMDDRQAAIATLKLANLHLELERFDDALSAAKEAENIFSKLGHVAGKREASRTVASIYTAKGEPEKSPCRQEALTHLQKVAEAVQRRDSEAYQQSMRMLTINGGMTNHDLNAAMSPMITRDTKGTTEFLKNNGLGVGAYQDSAQEVDTRELYCRFRSSGLQYGPAFRCVRDGFVRGKGSSEAEVLVVLQLDDGHEEWESRMQFVHPGIADGVLQAQMALA